MSVHNLLHCSMKVPTLGKMPQIDFFFHAPSWFRSSDLPVVSPTPYRILAVGCVGYIE